jgi:hypothetical protein
MSGRRKETIMLVLKSLALVSWLSLGNLHPAAAPAQCDPDTGQLPAIQMPAPVPMQGTCSDKDGGDVPGVASYAVDGGGAWYVDSCVAGRTQLREMICAGYFVTFVYHNCTCVNVNINIPGYGTAVSAKCQ